MSTLTARTAVRIDYICPEQGFRTRPDSGWTVVINERKIKLLRPFMSCPPRADSPLKEQQQCHQAASQQDFDLNFPFMCPLPQSICHFRFSVKFFSTSFLLVLMLDALFQHLVLGFYYKFQNHFCLMLTAIINNA